MAKLDKLRPEIMAIVRNRGCVLVFDDDFYFEVLGEMTLVLRGAPPISDLDYLQLGMSHFLFYNTPIVWCSRG